MKKKERKKRMRGRERGKEKGRERLNVKEIDSENYAYFSPGKKIYSEHTSHDKQIQENYDDKQSVKMTAIVIIKTMTMRMMTIRTITSMTEKHTLVQFSIT